MTDLCMGPHNCTLVYMYIFFVDIYSYIDCAGCWMLASMMEGMDDSTSGRHLSFRKMPGSTGNETVCETSESHYLFRSSVVERHSSISAAGLYQYEEFKTT